MLLLFSEMDTGLMPATWFAWLVAGLAFMLDKAGRTGVM
jgi:hypothetical protein